MPAFRSCSGTTWSSAGSAASGGSDGWRAPTSAGTCSTAPAPTSVAGTSWSGRWKTAGRSACSKGGRPLEGGTRRKPDSVLELYPTTRWATYFAYLCTPGAEPARRLLPPVISRHWAKRRPDLPIETLRIVFVQDLPPFGGGAPGPREMVWYDGPPDGTGTSAAGVFAREPG